MRKKTEKPTQAAPDAAAPAHAAPNGPAETPAPREGTTRQQDRLARIPMVLLKPSPHNPRTIREDDPALQELAASIRANGLVQPAVVRESPLYAGSYEILAGERRFRAHKLIGAEDMLCIVKDLDDKAALEVTVLENLQRTDLTPLEEARGVQALLDTGHTAAEIGGELGKSAQWVARRARLTHLTPEARERFQADGSTVAQMLAFAALPPDVQARSLVDMDKWLFKPERKEAFLQELAARQQILAKAPFDTKDGGLVPNTPDCAACFRRTGCNPDLFGTDTESAEEDRCLDGDCWNLKVNATMRNKLAAARAEHPELLLVRTEYAGHKDIDRLPAVGADTDAPIVKAKAPGAKPAFVAYGAKAGSVVWVVPPKDGAPDKRERGADGKPTPPKPHERRQQLHWKRCAWMVQEFSARTEDGIMHQLSQAFARMDAGKQLNILLAFGSNVRHDSSYKRETAWEDYEDFGGDKGPDAGTLEAAFDNHLAPIFRGRVTYTGLDQAEAAFVEACRICRLMGVCLFATRHQACMKAVPVPKSWAGVADPWADGHDKNGEPCVKDPYDPEYEQPRKFKK